MGILEELRELQTFSTPIIHLKTTSNENEIYIKKEENIPFSFGGNKVRIAANYFIDLIKKNCDSVITYGASTSNMCRVVANFAYRYGVSCTIVSPQEAYKETANSLLVKSLGAKIVTTPIDRVHQTIEDTIARHEAEGRNPYFIYGGGHGKLGTDAYRVVMEQIHDYEERSKILFNYIFITVGTGTSISGLIVENRNFHKNIVGISIARELQRASSILAEAITTYSDEDTAPNYEERCYGHSTERYDEQSPELHYELYDYRLGGYGKYNVDVEATIRDVYSRDGLNLDATYTGKAFTGMKHFLRERNIVHQNILFIHTGGTPLFFDALLKQNTTPPPPNYRSILDHFYILHILYIIGCVIQEHAYVR